MERKTSAWKGSPLRAWKEGEDDTPTVEMFLNSLKPAKLSIAEDCDHGKHTKSGFNPYDKKR